MNIDRMSIGVNNSSVSVECHLRSKKKINVIILILLQV